MSDPDDEGLAEQYADGENLSARIRLHEAHEVADREWWPWVFDRCEAVPDGADVLEVGCGTGALWAAVADRVPGDWTLLATDFSPGMAREARATLDGTGVDAGVAVAAAESLPVPDGAVDAVIANHVLYHVDRETALPEIRRVLRPGGYLFATTNGESNMRELWDLLRTAADYDPPHVGEFSLESGGARLARHFEGVGRFDRDCRLRVPEADPLVAYAASLPGLDGDDVADVAALAEHRLADGPLEIEKSMGMFVARTAPGAGA